MSGEGAAGAAEADRRHHGQRAAPRWQKHPNQDFLQIDTTNILFICGGAFDGLEKVIQTVPSRSASVLRRSARARRSGLRSVPRGRTEDLIKFGMIPGTDRPDARGRHLGELTEDALVQILTEPKNALVKQYQQLLSMEGVELEIRPRGLVGHCPKALARKTGARGLRSIVEQSLLDTMFELPTKDRSEGGWMNPPSRENAKPLLVYREQAKVLGRHFGPPDWAPLKTVPFRGFSGALVFCP